MDNDEEVKRAILKSIHCFKKKLTIWLQNMEQKPDIPSRDKAENQKHIEQSSHIYQKGWHGEISSNSRH